MEKTLTNMKKVRIVTETGYRWVSGTGQKEKKHMKIILDVMSGSHAPGAAVLAALDIWECRKIPVALVGRETQIRRTLQENGVESLPRGLEIADASDGLGTKDTLFDLVRRGPDASLLTGLRLLSEGRGDVLISPVSLDTMLSGLPLQREIRSVLAQAEAANLMSCGEVTRIRSLGDTVGFVGGKLKQMLKSNPRMILRVLRSGPGVGELKRLTENRGIMRFLRVRKPLILVPGDSDRHALYRAMEQSVHADGSNRLQIPDCYGIL